MNRGRGGTGRGRTGASELLSGPQRPEKKERKSRYFPSPSPCFFSVFIASSSTPRLPLRNNLSVPSVGAVSVAVVFVRSSDVRTPTQ